MAVESYKECLEILGQLGDGYSLAVAQNNLGNICYRQGDWTAALENYNSSLAVFEKVGDAESMASVLSNVASICYKNGDWSQALESYQKSLDLFEKLDDLAGEARVLGNLGNFYYRRGERSLALEHFQRGLELLERQGDRQGAAEMQANIDMVKISQGGFCLQWMTIRNISGSCRIVATSLARPRCWGRWQVPMQIDVSGTLLLIAIKKAWRSLGRLARYIIRLR